MNYACSQLLPLCLKCGDPHPEESLDEAGWCPACGCGKCGNTGEGFERWCDCAAGDAAHAAEAARFGGVSKKALVSVLELPEMIEYLDVCLWARPVLTRGLTLRVQSWEGRTIAGDILFPGRAVPLSPAEIDAFTRRAA